MCVTGAYRNCDHWLRCVVVRSIRYLWKCCRNLRTTVDIVKTVIGYFSRLSPCVIVRYHCCHCYYNTTAVITTTVIANTILLMSLLLQYCWWHCYYNTSSVVAISIPRTAVIANIILLMSLLHSHTSAVSTTAIRQPPALYCITAV